VFSEGEEDVRKDDDKIKKRLCPTAKKCQTCAYLSTIAIIIVLSCIVEEEDVCRS